MEHSKSQILLKLYARLKQSPCTIDILKKWKRKNSYTFSDRSLYRYLDELSTSLTISDEKIETYSNENNRKTWKLEFEKGSRRLSVFDINTFYLTKHFVPQSIIEHRRDSFAKIENIIYAQQSKDKFEYTVDANHLAFGNTNFYDIVYTKKQQQQIEELIGAIQRKQGIIINVLDATTGAYHSGHGTGNEVFLVSMKYHRGALKLCCYNKSTKNVVVIPLDILKDFTIADKHFDAKKYDKLIEHFFNTHFGITENINDKIYNIELEFTEPTGRYVSQFFWHNTQQFSTFINGNILMKMNCGINRELVGWIFQWMSNVKVRKPRLLHEMVVEKYNECLSIHNNEQELCYNNSFKIRGQK